MCIHIGEISDPLKVMEEQVRFIKEQESDKELHARIIKVRCPCLTILPIKYAYRCLYCGIYFCKSCAERHFGQTVAEYKSKRKNDAVE